MSSSNDGEARVDTEGILSRSSQVWCSCRSTVNAARLKSRHRCNLSHTIKNSDMCSFNKSEQRPTVSNCHVGMQSFRGWDAAIHLPLWVLLFRRGKNEALPRRTRYALFRQHCSLPERTGRFEWQKGIQHCLTQSTKRAKLLKQCDAVAGTLCASCFALPPGRGHRRKRWWVAAASSTRGGSG